MQRKFIHGIIFSVLLTSFLLIVWLYGRVLSRNLKAEIYNEFSTVGKIKHNALKNWYDEECSNAVITTDPADIVKHMNLVAEQLTGWKEEEAVGRAIEEVFHIISKESRMQVESPVLKVLREETGCQPCRC